MKEQQSSGVQVPGTEDAINGALDVKTVNEMARRDLSVAISFLNAILSDPDLLNHLAHFMHGRIMNARHAKEELK